MELDAIKAAIACSQEGSTRRELGRLHGVLYYCFVWMEKPEEADMVLARLMFLDLDFRTWHCVLRSLSTMKGQLEMWEIALERAKSLCESEGTLLGLEVADE